MNDSDVSTILSTEDYRELMESVAAKSSAQFSIIPSVSSTSSQATASHNSPIEETDAGQIFHGEIDSYKKEGEDPTLIIYTSGTTGKPKGVVHTHKSITAQVQTLTEAWEYTSSDQFLHCLPLHQFLHDLI